MRVTEPRYLEAIEHVAFVCGCGHSGTTLLARILGAHPEVFVPSNETNAFLTESKMEERLARIERNTLASARPYLVEKTPRHLRKIDLIRALVPGAKFVIIVRDGRDVTASIGKRENGDFAGAISRWVDDNRRVLRERGKADVHIVRYEDIVTRPEATIRKVTAFLGLTFDSKMLRYYEQPTNWFGRAMVRETFRPGREHGDRRNWQVNQPIFDGRGKWKKDLPEAFRARFDKGPPAEVMLSFGYDTPLAFRIDRALRRTARRLLRRPA